MARSGVNPQLFHGVFDPVANVMANIRQDIIGANAMSSQVKVVLHTLDAHSHINYFINELGGTLTLNEKAELLELKKAIEALYNDLVNGPDLRDGFNRGTPMLSRALNLPQVPASTKSSIIQMVNIVNPGFLSSTG